MVASRPCGAGEQSRGTRWKRIIYRESGNPKLKTHIYILRSSYVRGGVLVPGKVLRTPDRARPKHSYSRPPQPRDQSQHSSDKRGCFQYAVRRYRLYGYPGTESVRVKANKLTSHQGVSGSELIVLFFFLVFFGRIAGYAAPKHPPRRFGPGVEGLRVVRTPPLHERSFGGALSYAARSGTPATPVGQLCLPSHSIHHGDVRISNAGAGGCSISIRGAEGASESWLFVTTTCGLEPSSFLLVVPALPATRCCGPQATVEARS